jgi:hypothetical protein
MNRPGETNIQVHPTHSFRESYLFQQSWNDLSQDFRCGTTFFSPSDRHLLSFWTLHDQEVSDVDSLAPSKTYCRLGGVALIIIGRADRGTCLLDFYGGLGRLDI